MNNFQHITDIFFDLDHTLWDFDKNSALTFIKIFEINQLDIELEVFLKIYEPLNLSFWKLYRENKIDKATLRYRRLSETFTALSMPFTDELIHKLSDDYITYLTTYNHLIPHAAQLLEFLKPKFKLHIITNGFEEVQYGKMQKANIVHYFETITNSEMVGVKKPNPAIFEHALNKAQTSAKHSLMIGDNYEADILGARNMGMSVLYYDYHGEAAEDGVPVVFSLDEINGYFE